MENTIQKFIKLPAHIRTAVSSPEAIRRLEQIENANNMKLANIVMRVATKDIALTQSSAELINAIQRESRVSDEHAKEIADALRRYIFGGISNYLGLSGATQPQFDKPITNAEAGSLGVDEKDPEIAHHAQTLKYIPPAVTEYDPESLIARIVEVAGLTVDHVTHMRLKRLVESRLTDARDKLAVRELLMRSTKVGGMGLNEQIADIVIPLVEAEWEKVHRLQLKVKTEEKRKPVIIPKRDERLYRHPDISSQSKEPVSEPTQPQVSEPESIKPRLPVNPPPFGPPPVVPPPVMPPLTPPIAKTPEIKKLEPELPKQESAPLPPPKPHKDVPHFMPKMQRRTYTQDARTMHDIKAPSQLVGPVEELAQMTMQDFRNLGETIEESADRVEEKVRHLEKESYESRAEGVKGWRSSPIMKEYLAIGNDSMEKEKSVKDVIAERAQSGGTMTEREFEIIGRVNRTIRY